MSRVRCHIGLKRRMLSYGGSHMSKFYITNAIPYVNAKPHVGHALEFVQTDAIARYHKIIGNDVLTLCGGDENALKNVQAAEAEGKSVQEFIDANTDLFYDLSKKLNAQFDVWQKASSPKHHASSQKLWQRCKEAGDIYQREYSGLYCVGCELFYEKEELDTNGECFEHPGKKLEPVSEINYFFRLSKYQNILQELIESDSIEIIPLKRKNEALSFIKQGLIDISISRSNARAKNWGVKVPNDPTQRLYVWFDALNIYQSGIGFGAHERSEGARLRGEAEDKGGSSGLEKHMFTEKDYNYWWPADVHLIGKGILRFHAIYWPAFLLSAKLKLPKSIFVHGYFTVDGQKMSKTIGNVIDPIEMIEKYGVDALRYYFVREIPSTSDGDFSERRLKEIYNADLANGLGNLVARVAKLCETNNIQGYEPPTNFDPKLEQPLLEFKLHECIAHLWSEISEADKIINEKKPWELTGEEAKQVLEDLVEQVLHIAFNLQPFLPQTAEKILNQFSGEIKSALPLFPRI